MDLKKIVVPLIVIALLVAAAFTFLGGSETKTLTAHFPRTVSIYEGSDVRVLGVPIGKVDTVTPVRHRRGRDDVVRREGQGPRRRRGRHRVAVDRRRPLHPADAGVHRAAR